MELTVVTAARSFKKVAPSVSVKPEVDPEEEDPAEEVRVRKMEKEEGGIERKRVRGEGV